ncbi:MAG TPA: rhomboid family intramembrane serine protease [Solirubrobacteraceae bacterium]
MRCPECARERTKVKTIRSIPSTPVVTQALIAINVLAFVAETATGGPLGSGGGGTVWDKGVLFGPYVVHQHEYWRLLTAGFLHVGLFHLLVNMMSLYFVGTVLEPAIGRLNFIAVYFASLLTGSFGALLFQPGVQTAGASGAIFGIFGALIVVARDRGIPIWQSGLGVVLMINLVFSVTFAGISLGGHLGGLAGGLITGVMIVELSERRRRRGVALAGCALVAIASVAAALAVAGGHGLAPNGVGLGS